MSETLGLSMHASRLPTPFSSDTRLAALAADGDSRAFAAIYKRYHQELYRYCLAILGDPQDAQDALQEAMVAVMRALPGERREIRLKPWLYRIAHNTSIDFLRKRRPAQPLDGETELPDRSIEDSIETKARLRQLVSDLKALPERQRGALVMRELSGLSFEEIASSLNTSAQVARQTVYEARVSLEQITEGREMVCGEVKRVLSDGDGRILRRREIRSHLRSCEGCRDFQSAIKARQSDLASLAPLAPAASAGILESLLGGGKGGSSGGVLAGAAGGGIAPTVAGSAALKLGVAVVAAGAIAVPPLHAAGVLDPIASRDTGEAPRTQPGNPSEEPAAAPARRAGSEPGQPADAAGAANGHGPGEASGRGSEQAGYGQQIAAQRIPRELPSPARDRAPGGGSVPQRPPTPAPDPPSPPAGGSQPSGSPNVPSVPNVPNVQNVVPPPPPLP